MKAYLRACEEQTLFPSGLVHEAQRRIDQILFLLADVIRLERRAVAEQLKLTSYSDPQDEERVRLDIDQVETYVEAFYYFAFRLRTLMRNAPGWENFESRGVRDVRNHLLEHPKVILSSFSIGGPNGPVLRAARYVGEETPWEDRGLFVNARELIEALRTAMRKAPATPKGS
jgi:hypothetical protein